MMARGERAGVRRLAMVLVLGLALTACAEQIDPSAPHESDAR